jgi:RNA polymerase sigma-70 factor (ECF subfamily)
MAFGIEGDVLAKAAQGDSDAQAILVARVRPHIEKQLLRYPVTEEDRRDLLQATLVQILRRIGSFRGEASFSTWLFRVTANEALMLMRSQRRHRSRLVEGLTLEDLGALPGVQNDDQPEEEALAAERTAHVQHALAELPDGYRDVVSLHYHQGLGLQEIADQLAMTESAVRSRLHRARSRLREMLESAFGGGLTPQAA